MDPLSSTNCPQCGVSLAEAQIEGLCARCLGSLNFAPETVIPDEHNDIGTVLTPAELAPHFLQLDIIECLGRGGMGVVYKARQKTLNRLVALKLLAPERVTDAKFAKRFAHEAQALAALNHPNIVTIHDFGQAGGFYFLLMEYVDGVNLRQAMKAGRFTPEQALAVVPPVCEALQYAHEHSVVHRDIKPENLLLDKDGRVKIADFGIAKILGNDMAPASTDPSAAESSVDEGTLASVAGTPQYMAPEQKEHRTTDHRADIYSLGVVLYEMLTGELPTDKLQPPSRKVQIDVRLDEIVLRALEAKPERRYQTAGEFRTQVEAMTSGACLPPLNPSVAAAPSRFSRTAVVGAVCAALGLSHLIVCLAIGVIGIFNLTLWTTTLPQGWVGALIMAGIWSPFFATVLGWIAVSQIRRSEGRIHGMWLAVLNGLLFPLLALDASIFMPIILLFPVYSEGGMLPVWLILMLIGLGVFTGVLAILVNFLIIRAVCRTVNKPLNGATAKPIEISARRNQMVLAGLAVQIIILSLLGVRYLNWRWESSHWHSMPVQWGGSSPQDAAGELRIEEVRRDGRVVIFRIACESSHMPVNFQVSYSGQELESLPSADVLPSVTPLYAPTSKGNPVWSYAGMTFVGERWEHRTDKITLTRPGEFTLGFVLPDEERAELAVQQTRKLHPPGIRRHIAKSEGVILFIQIRKNGEKDSESLQAFVNVDFTDASYIPAPVASKTSALTFGPVVERTIMSFDETPTQAYLDLGSGEFRSPPAAIADDLRLLADNDRGQPFTELTIPGEERYGWLKTSGVDLIGGLGSDGHAKFKYIGQPPHYENGWTSFERADSEQVVQMLQGAPFALGDKPNLPAVYINEINPQLASVRNAKFILFRTHDGDVGILQVVGESQNSRGVKIRYKLVQSTSTTATSVRMPPPTDAPKAR